MKTLKYYISAFLLGSMFFACKDQLEVYSSSDNKVGFYNVSQNKIDTLLSHTFVFEDPTVTLDTLNIRMRTLGFVVNYDRPIKLKQVPTNDESAQAVAGTHYVPFDHPSIAKHYIIPANKNFTYIPLVIKRDPSLKEKKHYMRLVVENNEHFTQSWVGEDYIVIELSDLFTKPKEWTAALEYYFLGKYGQEKHKFMYEVTGVPIDDKYLKDILPNPNKADLGYLEYMSGYFSSKLREFNKINFENSGLLREKSEIENVEGPLVQFVLYNEPQPVI